jgi:predicted nuclease with TOPRIM domain
MKNRENILKAFKLRKEGKSLTKIEKATNIKRPYISFLFKHFDLEEIEKIAKNENLIKELKEKNKRIKELKEELEECTCWEELNFFEKLDLIYLYIIVSFIGSSISFLIAFYILYR